MSVLTESFLKQMMNTVSMKPITDMTSNSMNAVVMSVPNFVMSIPKDIEGEEDKKKDKEKDSAQVRWNVGHASKPQHNNREQRNGGKVKGGTPTHRSPR